MRKNKFKSGIIYLFIENIIFALCFLNLVEFFKFIAIKLLPKRKILVKRLSVDLFIILKWALITLLWYNNVKSIFVNYVVWYLIFTNIFTYFYYHIWDENSSKSKFDFSRVKRRFLNLLLSIGFNIFSFAYFFAVPFSRNFKCKNQIYTFQDYINFSVSNTLTSSYNSIESISNVGDKLVLIETVISFFYFTIILSNSIPQKNK